MDTSHRMNSTNTTVNGWGNDSAESNKKCEMNEWLNDGLSGGRSVFSYLPSELQSIITPVKVLSQQGNVDNTFTYTPVVSVSKLFLLSSAEVFGVANADTSANQGYISEINKWASICTRNSSNSVTKITQYSRLTTNNIRIKRSSYGTGSAVHCWLRSPCSTSCFVHVASGGNSYVGNATASGSVAPAFCTG